MVCQKHMAATSVPKNNKEPKNAAPTEPSEEKFDQDVGEEEQHPTVEEKEIHE